MLWQVENQVAQRREQLLEGMPQEQLENVLAEFWEEQIKAAKDTKAVKSMAKKQASVGEDEEAVAIAGLAVAGEAGEVAAGSAAAGEAEQDVVGSEDAPVRDDDGCGPPLMEPKAEPLLPGGRPLEDATSASSPGPKKQRIQFVVATEVPTRSTCPKFKKTSMSACATKPSITLPRRCPCPSRRTRSVASKSHSTVVSALQPWPTRGHTYPGSGSFGWIC